MVSVSSTSLVIRYVAVVPALTLAFWRMLSASGMLWGYCLASSGGSLSSINKKLTVFAGVFLGLHFAFFFLGVRHTSIANATLLGNTGPFFTALFALYAGQHISKKTYLGLGLALLGVLIVQGSSLNMGGEKIWGQLFWEIRVRFLQLFSHFTLGNTFPKKLTWGLAWLYLVF